MPGNDLARQIKEHLTARQVVELYGFHPDRGGYIQCPFHAGDNHGSLKVYDGNKSGWHCFGCGAGGDVITFIMKIENLDYVEAVKFLAQRAGMEMPENTYDDSLSKLRMRIYEANREAARFFHATLLSQRGQSGLNYLRGRALSDRTIRHFGI